MPVPQEMNFFVEQASCLFIKGLLTMVQDVRCNQAKSDRLTTLYRLRDP